MAARFLTLILLFAFCLLSVEAQETIQSFTDRNTFLAAARDVRVFDFEGIVPNSGFKHYQREGTDNVRHGVSELIGTGTIAFVSKVSPLKIPSEVSDT